jgi:hypothetical protein
LLHIARSRAVSSYSGEQQGRSGRIQGAGGLSANAEVTIETMN